MATALSTFTERVAVALCHIRSWPQNSLKGSLICVMERKKIEKAAVSFVNSFCFAGSLWLRIPNPKHLNCHKNKNFQLILQCVMNCEGNNCLF